MGDGNIDKTEGTTAIIDKPVFPPQPASGGNFQAPPGNPTAIGSPDDPNGKPLTGYDRKRAVRAAEEHLNLPPQTQGKK